MKRSLGLLLLIVLGAGMLLAVGGDGLTKNHITVVCAGPEVISVKREDVIYLRAFDNMLKDCTDNFKISIEPSGITKLTFEKIIQLIQAVKRHEPGHSAIELLKSKTISTSLQSETDDNIDTLLHAADYLEAPHIIQVFTDEIVRRLQIDPQRYILRDQDYCKLNALPALKKALIKQALDSKILSIAVKPVVIEPCNKPGASYFACNASGICNTAGIQFAAAWLNDDHTIKIVDLVTHKILSTLPGHIREVYSVAWSSGKKLLASGYYDKTIKIWDVSTSKCIKTLSEHIREVYSVAWSSGNKLLASGSYDKTIKIWDVSTGKRLKTLSEHDGPVYSVAWSPNGKFLASGSGDHTIKVWDVLTGECLKTLAGHGNSVSSVAWSPDGKTLASGSFDETAKLWDVATGKCINTLLADNAMVKSVVWSLDGKKIIVDKFGKVQVWDYTSFIDEAYRKANTLGHAARIIFWINNKCKEQK